jgi:hypothetical protein
MGLGHTLDSTLCEYRHSRIVRVAKLGSGDDSNIGTKSSCALILTCPIPAPTHTRPEEWVSYIACYPCERRTTMVVSLSPSKSVADVKRERDVANLHAAFRDIPDINNLGCSPDTHSIPNDYVPKQASDASLAAFCQLAALRLNAARSLISLIDDKYQYVLAEATPHTSLRAASPLNKSNDLGFGSVRLPRRYVDSCAIKRGGF